MKKEVAVGTVIQYAQRSNNNHTPRWDRTQRAQLFDQYLSLQAQGLSLRQAAKALEVPRSTLQAWRSYQESLDEHPAVVAFFQSAPGLAFLHRLVLGTNHVIIPFTNLGSEADLRLYVPPQRVVIADGQKPCELDACPTADDTVPRILADVTGSARLVGRQNAWDKSCPRGCRGLCAYANRSGSDTRR